MPEIPHKGLKKHLKNPGKEGFFSVYLIHGEEMLYKSALNELLDDKIEFERVEE